MSALVFAWLRFEPSVLCTSSDSLSLNRRNSPVKCKVLCKILRKVERFFCLDGKAVIRQRALHDSRLGQLLARQITAHQDEGLCWPFEQNIRTIPPERHPRLPF